MQHKAISHPLDMIQDLWRNSNTRNSSSFGEHEYFASLLSNPEIYQQVPFMQDSSMSISHRGLVSYRGIVQQTFGSELYMGTYREIDSKTQSIQVFTSKYAEEIQPSNSHCTIDINEDLIHDSKNMAERTPIVCGAIPGMSPWVENYCQRKQPTSTNTGLNLKRSIEAIEAGIHKIEFCDKMN
jgi:hypothetical protein